LEEILIKEISQQPIMLKRLLEKEFFNVCKIAANLKDTFKYIIIAARGSSDNAARYAQYVMGAFNHYQVALATPSIFTIYGQKTDFRDALVIGISQSGQSPDIVSVLESAKQQNCPTLSFTNHVDSPLAKVSDHIIQLHTGAEKAVAATKTYTASLSALAMLSISLNPDKKREKSLRDLPAVIEKAIPDFIRSARGAERYRYMEHCVVIGRGFNYATAFEIALKIKELTRVVAVPYSSADFRHGPIATVQTGFPVIVIASSGKMYQHIEEFTQKLISMGAEVISISDKKKMLSIGKLSFEIPDNIPEWLSPIINVIPGQLLARQLAREKGLNIDQPEGLSKVTETF